MVLGSVEAALAALSMDLRTYSLPPVPDTVWLCFDPEMPKGPCLFHESDGFRGCFALSQHLPKVAHP